MKIEFYPYFDFCVSLKITVYNSKIVGCNNHNMIKQVFSFPNKNDKHLETLIFAVTLPKMSTVKLQDNYHTKKIKKAQFI